ncbi:MAG: hypothetical protein HYZ52_03980 [Candidatus Omnitrophica bacterium]|nr:hypothetical protein [Candidatus Omnitrophota bacterium]
MKKFFIFLFFVFFVSPGYAENEPAPGKNRGGVIGALGDLEDAVKGPPEDRAKAGELPDGPSDEKFSDFVRRARADMDRKPTQPAPPAIQPPKSAKKNNDIAVPASPPRVVPPVEVPRKRHVPADLPEEKEALRKAGLPESTSLMDLPPEALKALYSDGTDGVVFKPQPEFDSKPLSHETQEPLPEPSEFQTKTNSGPQISEPEADKKIDVLKEAYDTAKGVKWSAKAGGFGMTGKAAGKTADALKGARSLGETIRDERSGATKAAELAAKYGGGPVVGVLAKPAAGAVQATAEGMDKANRTMDNPTEENKARLSEHVENLPYEISKNAGLDMKEAKKKAGGARDWFYDQAYKVAPGLIPAKEREKRDRLREGKEGGSALREYAGAPSEEQQEKLDAEEQEKLLQKWVDKKE